MHPGLVAPPFPSGLEYLFSAILVADEDKPNIMHLRIGGWFGELTTRRPRGFGLCPIPFSEMKAWAELTGRNPSPLETYALTAIDDSFVSIFSKNG